MNNSNKQIYGLDRIFERPKKGYFKVGYARRCTISKTRQNIRADYMYIPKVISTRPRSKAQNSESYVHQSVIDLIYFFSIFLDSVEFARP